LAHRFCREKKEWMRSASFIFFSQEREMREVQKVKTSNELLLLKADLAKGKYRKNIYF